MARKTKLTSETLEGIVQALSMGATHRLACQYGGITESTLYAWLAKGEQGKAPYVEFSEAVKKAEGQAAVRWLEQIDVAASEGHWQAAAWKLERRYPHEYGRQVVEQHHSGSLEVHETLLRDALERAEALRAANGSTAGKAPN